METNNSIKCTINECSHHAGEVDYCTLKCIRVGACECPTASKEGTDCESFNLK